MNHYDYLIVGSALFGAAFAYRIITKIKHFVPFCFSP